jgi:DNA-binding transcriptional LysR family regulator
MDTFDLDALRTFVSGIELGSYAKAADLLGRSTSAVSAQLKKLEGQVEAPVLRKSGRGLQLTPSGEVLFSYAKRLLSLNDEAAAAICGSLLKGSVRIGIQEDFGETLLAETLGSFARSHPQVQIEATVARNARLLEMLSKGKLDIALAWDDGHRWAYGRTVAILPMRWIGRVEGLKNRTDEPQALVVLEAPCLLRNYAIQALDKARNPWHIAFTGSSLSSVWAAVSAGLGVTVRTGVGLPSHLRVLDGLPKLPRIKLLILRSASTVPPHIGHLERILLERVGSLVSAVSLT